jgi:glycosyltransferase involved in cell wall biosynthesis
MSALVARLRSAARKRLPRRTRRVLLVAGFSFALGGLALTVVAPELAVRILGALLLVVGLALALVAPPSKPPAGSRKKRARHVPLTGGARLLADYAELAKPRGQRAFMSTLLRTRSRPAREILAHLASGGRRDLHGILTTFEEFRDPALAPLALESLSVVDSRLLAVMGRVLLVQQQTPQDALDAATAFDVLAARGASQPGSSTYRQIYAEALIAAGRADDARALAAGWRDVTGSERRVIADAVNPFVDGGAGRASGAWLDLVNREWNEAGLEGIRLSGAAGAPFDRIHVEPVPGAEVSVIDDGPLVTVIVTSFRPGVDLLTSVRSILDSSWRHLEVLVVDDASGADFDAVHAEVAALDDRVRILTLAQNGGTYRARNAALDSARGELVTFQDSDDWMHPRRLELQVRHLEAHPEVIANTSLSVRVTDDLEFSHHRNPQAKVCEPSLLIRKDAVLERVGYFDLLRKGADVEYRHRLAAAFGDPVETLDGPPLTWQRTRRGSLSDDDIGREWVSPVRRAYQASYRRWHAAIAAGAADPRRTRDETSPRAFFAPDELIGVPREVPHYDVVFVSNWLAVGSLGGSQRSNAEEVRALAAAGYRVAIANIEAFRFMHWRSSRLSDRALDLLELDGVDLVHLGSVLTCDLVMVRYPPVLQFLDPAPSAWTVGQVVIVGNQAPYERDGTGRRYDIATCARRVEEVFGRTPTWMPLGPVIREIYERLVPPSQLAAHDLPPIVERAEWQVSRAPRSGRRPVIGRYSRDTDPKWPAEAEDLLAAYASPHFDTWIMGGPETLGKVLGERPFPATWQVWPSNAMPVREFLAGIDFFVYFPHPALREAYGRSIVEALASGAVVILPPSFEPVFGAAARYAEPRDVERLVGELFADDSAFERQVAAGHAFGSHTSRAAYTERIAAMLSGEVA